MKFEWLPYDKERYATALRKDDRSQMLVWDSAAGQDAVIVQTPFGVEAKNHLDELCAALNQRQPKLSGYVEVLKNIWLCYVSAVDKAKNRGCPLHGIACTYTVFSCEMEGEHFRIYEPMSQSMISPSCHVPLEIRGEVQKVEQKKGGLSFFKFGKSDTSDSGFYRIEFPDGLPQGYQDGSIVYQVSGMEIPITAEMLEWKNIYVQTVMKPDLRAKSSGVKLV